VPRESNGPDDEAIRLDPEQAIAFNSRGNAWAEKKEYERAIKDYDEALRLDPRDSLAFNNRGSVWSDKKEYERAIKDFDEAIRLDPKDPLAFHNRGDAWYFRGKYERALKDYEEAIRIDPTHVRSYHLTAWIKATCPDDKYRDGKKAIELATKACELTAWKAGGCLDTLAAAYAETGHFDKAVKFQRQALELLEAEKRDGEAARARLKLFEEKKPYRDTK
jgi:tetratricopeptide (TPR) repeat protein